MRQILKKSMMLLLSALLLLPTFALTSCELSEAADPNREKTTEAAKEFTDPVLAGENCMIAMEKSEHIGFELVGGKTGGASQTNGIVTISKESDLNELAGVMSFGLIATVLPEDLPEERKAVTWRVEWATSGVVGEVSEYVETSVNTAIGGRGLLVQVLKPFRGFQIRITCTTVYGNFSAQCLVEYTGKPANLWLTESGTDVDASVGVFDFPEDELAYSGMGINVISEDDASVTDEALENYGTIYYKINLGNLFNDVGDSFYENVSASVKLNGTANMELALKDGSYSHKSIELSSLGASTFARIQLTRVSDYDYDAGAGAACLVLAVKPELAFSAYTQVSNHTDPNYTGRLWKVKSLEDAYYEVTLQVNGYPLTTEIYRFIVETDVQSVTLNKDQIIF